MAHQLLSAFLTEALSVPPVAMTYICHSEQPPYSQSVLLL